MNGRNKSFIPNFLSNAYQYFFSAKTVAKKEYQFRFFNELQPQIQHLICQFSPLSMICLNKQWNQFLSKELKAFEYHAQLKTQSILCNFQINIIRFRFDSTYSGIKQLEQEFYYLDLKLLPNGIGNITKEMEEKLDLALHAEITKHELLDAIEAVDGAKACSIKLQAVRCELNKWKAGHCHEQRLLSKISLLKRLQNDKASCISKRARKLKKA